MTFHLKQFPFGTTLSRQIARQHLTRFNNVFWVAEHSAKHVRQAYSHLTMPTPGHGVHGYFPDEKTWQSATDEFRAWTRQHVLLSAASLLEVYVKSASSTALWAKPEHIDQSLSGVDGFKFIKSSSKENRYLEELIKSRSDGFVVGQWSDRLVRIKQVFGVLDHNLLSLESSLQSLQNRRNKIAHQFGTNNANRRVPWEAISTIEVSKNDVVSGIRAVSQAIRLFDAMFGPIIAGHELLHEFHVWKSRQKNYQYLLVSGKLSRAFRQHLGDVYGRPIGATYVSDLISYYNAT